MQLMEHMNLFLDENNPKIVQMKNEYVNSHMVVAT